MSPVASRIVTLQRQLRERGRIRIGVKVATRSGKTAPKKLDTFRFTAPDEATTALVAQLYGGTVEPWPDGGRDRWQVTTERDSIPVAFPTQMSFSQAFEQWAGGYCTRRCDGVTSTVPGNRRRLEDDDCQCDPDNRACKITTHLSVIAPELPGLGTWRLVTRGYYAGSELAATVELIEMAMSRGAVVPARLFLEQRTVRRLEDGKPKKMDFVVPALDLDVSVGALGPGLTPQAAAVAGGNTPELSAGPGWRPVQQEALPPAPAVSVRSQLDEAEVDPPRRRNAPPTIKPTGAKPRPTAQADSGTCDLCGETYGTGPLKRNPEPGSKYVHTACIDGQPDDAPAWDEAAAAAHAAQPPADSQGPDRSAGEAQSGGRDADPPAEPSPAGNGTHDRTMTHKQHRQVMALTAEAFPRIDGEDGGATDARRRELLLALVAHLGQPGLTSRTQISHATAGPLIDALQAIKAGTHYFDGQLQEIAT